MLALRRLCRGLWVVAMAAALASCASLGGEKQPALSASGVVEAPEISVSSELPGLVAEVFVEEGEPVRAGDALFRLEGTALEAQLAQAIAAEETAAAGLEAARSTVGAAEAAVKTAEAGREAAALQVELQLAAALGEEAPSRRARWYQAVPWQFDLPAWYFSPEEQLQAAERGLQAAKDALEAAEGALEEDLEALGPEALAREMALEEARQAFLLADAMRRRTIEGLESGVLRDQVEERYEDARLALQQAQEAYEQVLTEEQADALLEARARVAAAWDGYQEARLGYYALLAGDQSLGVQAAAAGLAQAEAQVGQAEAALAQAKAQVAYAEKNLAQAQAARSAIEQQIQKLTIRAPIDGTILVRTVDPGEVIQPGVVGVTLGILTDLRITVYLPENQYGKVQLGDRAEVRADSFPDETFEAEVIRIADEAEYTPRNVQTQEERQTTVYAITLSLKGTEGKLKPGMPADVIFQP